MAADQAGWDQDRQRATKDLLTMISSASDHLMAIGKLNHDRCCHIAGLILKKRAIAVGFPEGATGEPEIIPAYLFKYPKYIKWGDSIVTGNGLNYISVHVTKLRPSDQLLEAPIKAEVKALSKAGRRASSEIIDIIQELNATPEFGKLPGKAQAKLIIDKAQEKYPERYKNGKGISLPTVYRYLGKVLGV